MTYPRREKRKATVVENRPKNVSFYNITIISIFGAKIQIYEKNRSKDHFGAKIQIFEKSQKNYFGAKIQIFGK